MRCYKVKGSKNVQVHVQKLLSLSKIKQAGVSSLLNLTICLKFKILNFDFKYMEPKKVTVGAKSAHSNAFLKSLSALTKSKAK